ncbi:MAG: GNAT family N-acetyltransferase [Phenylobacterium sp.]
MRAPSIRIRSEEEPDFPAIHDLTRRAFAPMPFSAGDEPDLIDALRRLGALELSLVAELDGAVVGHVAISPAAHESGAGGWFALGPISVEPALQRCGAGGALIAEVRRWLSDHGAHGCILTGDPRYYPRHGFQPAPGHAPEAEPAGFFMVLPLAGDIPAGRFRFHPAFGA